jgi:hypothetical protein
MEPILAADSAARGHPPSGDESGGIAATDNATQEATMTAAADLPKSARGADASVATATPIAASKIGSSQA